MNKHLFTPFANIVAVILLVSLVAAPIYFAKNFTNVAGVKSQSQYLIVSQVEKFPGMTFAQSGNKYQISFNKIAESQAYLAVMTITNPTDRTQTYELGATSGTSKPFFGQDINNQLNELSLPSGATVPISLFSEGEAAAQSVEFRIIADSE